MISEYTKSLKIYSRCFFGAHFIALCYVFPMAVFTVLGSVFMFLVLYKWIELVYDIEQANRDNLIMLINSTDNESTKNLLLTELWYADLHSLGAETWEGINPRI